MEQDFLSHVQRCREALGQLFDAAKAKEEMQFAMALNPEFRGMQDAGWSTAFEASRALDEYMGLLNELPPGSIKIRVALSLYSHVSEAAGFYEVPKNMMRIASGDDYNLWPFQHLVARHAATGSAISPNSNKVMRDLLGHADELKLESLKAVILENFDPDLRNGYAHADYVIWQDGIRLPKRNGGRAVTISFDDFTWKLNKAVGFFQALREYIMECVKSFDPPRRIMGRMNKSDPVLPAEISYNPTTGAFSIRTGLGI